MESDPQGAFNHEGNLNHRKERSTEQTSFSAPISGGYRLFNRRRSIREIIGNEKAADLMLWKHRQVSLAVITVATSAWLIVERSGLSFLSISSDVLLILIAIQFLRANIAVLRNRPLQPLPELVLSEEMVNNAALSIRAKINSLLQMAHNITLGRDFRVFVKVVVFLWLLSVIGSLFSLFTLTYVGIIVSITVPALYHKYEHNVDRCAGVVHHKFSSHLKRVDENILQRLPKRD